MYSTKYHQYSQRKIQQTIKNNHTPRCFPHRGYFLRNMHGKSRKMRGKSGNFRGIHSSKWLNRREILRSFSVVFAVISGENWRISEKIREYRRKMENIGEIFPFSFRFYSFSFLLLKSARFYALQHVYCRYFVREVECLKYYCYFCT